jgi:hypothetical protein
MTTINEKTVILGSEYDDSLREVLRNVLMQLGGKGFSCDWGVGGSQEIERTQVQLGANRVIIEAETYIGLSIRGPSELVNQIRDIVMSVMSKRE